MIDALTIALEPHGFAGPVSGPCQHVHSDRTVCGASLDEHPAHRPAASPAAFVARVITRELVAAAPAWRPCEATTITCPRGCGFLSTVRPHVYWGPWRMQLHLMNPRCPTPIRGMTPTRGRRR